MKRNKPIAAAFSILFSIFLISILFSCSYEDTQEKMQENGDKKNDVLVLDVAILENENRQLTFNISVKDFINSYNSFYSMENGKDYLPPLHEWPFYNTMAIHSDNEVLRYYFSEDESIRSIPEISVFSPTTDDTIQQIMICYDDHSYSIPTYEMYEEMCLYAVRTMMPELQHDEAVELCEQINGVADEHINTVPYSSDAVPQALYYKEDAGVYSYSCIGEELRFCIIPITEEKLREFKAAGTEVAAINNR